MAAFESLLQPLFPRHNLLEVKEFQVNIQRVQQKHYMKGATAVYRLQYTNYE